MDTDKEFLEIIKFIICGPLEIALDMISDRVQYKQNHMNMIKARNQQNVKEDNS